MKNYIRVYFSVIPRVHEPLYELLAARLDGVPVRFRAQVVRDLLKKGLDSSLSSTAGAMVQSKASDAPDKGKRWPLGAR